MCVFLCVCLCVFLSFSVLDDGGLQAWSVANVLKAARCVGLAAVPTSYLVCTCNTLLEGDATRLEASCTKRDNA